MPRYTVKIGFWLRAYDSAEIEADSPGEIIERAKAAAREMMEQSGQPEHIELTARREGIICWIDGSDVPIGDDTVAEDVEFDDDRINPEPVAAPAEVVAAE
ncbi:MULTISPECIES: hypothetical protein [Asaia]|uniref:DUF1902 domain-containing protein n=1 Tax=Asaia spathodeae TaxID=657016 RepID=A0ABX2P7Z2_9PROT|nr:hypothetical protein [Asaia spathodeae]GBR20023.1 hypothetical protein AA105894_2450 [Asaia spathodeae NBRC 105894]